MRALGKIPAEPALIPPAPGADLTEDRMKSLIRKLGLVALTSVALAATLSAPASAAVSRPAAATAAPAAVAAADDRVCVDPVWGGNRICAYSLHDFTLPDGTRHMFVIGTDYSVYTKWKRPNGTYSSWVNMGGQIRRSYSVSDFRVNACGTQPVIRVVGTDNRWYFKARRTSGSWTDWILGSTIACPAS